MEINIKETRGFTESDLEPLTKEQLIHLLYARVLGFDGMERTRQRQRSTDPDYDGCVDCRSIASRLGLHEPDTCIRCGVVLDTDEGVQTGICPACWKPETDQEVEFVDGEWKHE